MSRKNPEDYRKASERTMRLRRDRGQTAELPKTNHAQEWVHHYNERQWELPGDIRREPMQARHHDSPEGLIIPQPAECVDLRREQVELFTRKEEWVRQMAMQGRIGAADDPKQEAEMARLWFCATLREAELYWVSGDMCTLLEAVAPTMPDVTPAPPVPDGLVIFARPLAGLDAVTGTSLRTAAYLWGSVLMRSKGGRSIPCLDIETFGWRDTMRAEGASEAEVASFREVMPTRLVSTGGSEWPLTALTSDFLGAMPAFNERQQVSMLEDRRMVAAFWSLCQDRITIESEERGNRQMMRRMARAGLPTSPVRVITLRESTASHEVTGEHANYSHRFMVSAHWRQQPYGPGRSKRRAQLIPSYIKGPADKPLVIRETVKALRR